VKKELKKRGKDMRTGGLISDFAGEARVSEPGLIIDESFGASALLSWKGGRFEMGYPLGSPLGVDASIGFQVYSDGVLVEGTPEPRAMVAVEDDVLNWFEVIAVATHLLTTDQSNVIARTFGRRVRLTWPASASDDVASYRVFDDQAAGGVDYDTVLAEVDAKPGGVALSEYSWTSDELTAGTWTFGIRAVDAAGNVRTTPVLEVSKTVLTVPDPASDLAHSYDSDDHTVTLTWTAPGRWA
jgi:hypothetical protein